MRRSSTEPIRSASSKYPGLEFKLDPENDWDADLIARDRGEWRAVQVLDLKGFYQGTAVEVETDPELYRAVAETFPEAYLEDPDLNDETREVLEPARRPGHLGRAAALARRRQGELRPEQGDQLQAVAVGLAGGAASRSTSTASARASPIYCGGQGEVGVGRGQIQYLASLFHPDTPNDIAPSGYNDPAVPAGMPTSPMDPVPSETGFRWS